MQSWALGNVLAKTSIQDKENIKTHQAEQYVQSDLALHPAGGHHHLPLYQPTFVGASGRLLMLL